MKDRTEIYTSLGPFHVTREYGEFNLSYRVTTRENKDLMTTQFIDQNVLLSRTRVRLILGRQK